MSITPLPSAPAVTDTTAEFNTKAFAWVAALGDFTTEANALADQVETDADTASTAATNAAESELAAVAAANYKGEWSTLTGALNIPASVSHNSAVWVLTENIADVTTDEPGVNSPSKWLLITLPPQAGNAGKFLTTDGSIFSWGTVASGSFLRQTVFTSSGTWTKGTGTKYILVEGVGGGGGGGYNINNDIYYNGGGGGAGGYSRKFMDVSNVSSVSVTIGNGGNTASSGGTTTFGTYITCNGGGGGSNNGGGSSPDGGAGGSATGGDINVTGGSGSASIKYGSGSGNGGGGGGSYFGGGGGAVFGTGPQNGVAYGSGGSGGWSGWSSGSGAQGVVIVWEFA